MKESVLSSSHGLQDNSERAKKLPNLTVLIFLSAISVLPLNMFIPSLPHIAEALNSDYALANLAISGYALMSAITHVVSGILSDRFGRRPVAVAALLIFLLASVMCSIAPDITTFLVFRTLQGVVIACYAVSMAAIRDTSDDRQTTRRIALLSSVWALAPMLGPTLGAALDVWFGWRANFITFAILGMIGLVLVLRGFAETKTRDPHARFQFASYLAPMASRTFWGYAICMVFSMGTLYIFLSGAPLVAQHFDIGSAIMVGPMMGLVPAAFILGSMFVGRFGNRYSPARLMVTGRLLTLSGLAIGVLLFAAGIDHAASFFVPCAFVGLGNGLTMPAANAGVMSLRTQRSATTLGLANAITVTGGAVIVSLSGTLLFVEDAHATSLLLMIGTTVISLLAALSIMLKKADKA